MNKNYILNFNIIAFTFAAELVPGLKTGIKMGIRFNSGAIPVAVIPMQKRLHCIFRLYKTTVLLRRTGRYLKIGKARRPASLINNHSKLSGERHGV
jgi:hypothetical protein